MTAQKYNTSIIHNIPSTLSLIKTHVIYIVSFFVISFLIFGNTFGNEFAVVDDLAGYIENEQIRNLPRSIGTFKLQEIIYALNYMFFQLNPLPLRIFAVINHGIAASLLFLIILQVFNKKTAVIACLLFLVHPVNTEVINWISAQFYTVQSIFLFLGFLFLIKFRSSSQKKYLYFILTLFALEIVLIRHPWVFIFPFAVTTFDLFLLEKKSSQKFYGIFLTGIICFSLLFGIVQFSGQFSDRMESRSASGRVLQNQQLLTPVLESYPYTIYNLVRLYIFPKDLTIYYDGNKMTTTTFFIMYLTFIMYVVAIWYFLKKNKKIAGLLILIVVLILPVFSPKKLTWYITERYLYSGTGFFTTLLALFLISIEKKINWKHVAFICASIMFIVYAYRSFLRNVEWKTPETLALATIKTSPYSVRPYNDLAGYYVLQGNYSEGKRYYLQALSVSSSLTAIRNLGHIFIETGLDPTIQTTDRSVDDLYAESMRLINMQEYYQAMYYLNEIIAKNPLHIDALNRAIELFVLFEKYDVATDYLEKIENLQLSNADTYYIRAYMAYAQKDIETAKEFIHKTLEINPQHSGALKLLKHL